MFRIPFSHWIRRGQQGQTVGAKARPPRAVPQLEPLENRDLLAAGLLSKRLFLASTIGPAPVAPAPVRPPAPVPLPPAAPPPAPAPVLGGLAGFVYADGNNNGIKEPGEAGIAGATILLSGTDDGGQAVALFQTTGADGGYRFANLRAGTYTITEVQPADFLDGKDSLGSSGGSAANDRFSNIVLQTGGSGENYNFGELAPASISGHVFVDDNNNGRRDPGEASINGVLVTLTGTDDLGQKVSITRATVAGNSYSFTNLRPGTYTVSETQPADYLDGKDAPGTHGGDAADDRLSNIELRPGTAAREYNFGELAPAAISGYVYEDANNNGVKDPGEGGIGGVSVTLTGTDDLGQKVNTTLTTKADGRYEFLQLRPGVYTVTEIQPANYLDGKDSIGSAAGTAKNDQFTNIVLHSGTVSANNNFGELAPGSLCGCVYVDANDNGIKEEREIGIAGVSILLTGTDDLGQAVSQTATTGADGTYCFKDLRPGNYTIREVQPANYLNGKMTIGTLGGTCLVDRFVVAMNPGARGENYNFGELSPPAPPPPSVYVPPPPAYADPFGYAGLSKRQFLASSFRSR